MRVLSFNIRYGTANDGSNGWDHRRETVAHIIRDTDADFACLQEAQHFQLEFLDSRLGPVRRIGAGRDDGTMWGEYCAIFYRTDRWRVTAEGTFWLSDTPDVPGSRTWGNPLPRICTWGRFEPHESTPERRPLFVYNCHLDHESQISREKAAELIAARMAARVPAWPIVLCGDFNMVEKNSVFGYLRGELPSPRAANPSSHSAPPSPALRDSFRLLHPQATDNGTFHSWSGNRHSDKIDFIFIGAELAAINAAIVHTQIPTGRYPSDHFPIRADLHFADGGDSTAR